jgi:hypothetical protein
MNAMSLTQALPAQLKQTLKNTMRDGVVTEAEGDALFAMLQQMNSAGALREVPNQMAGDDLWISATGGWQDVFVELFPHEGKLYVKYTSFETPETSTYEVAEFTAQEVADLVPSSFDEVSFRALDIHGSYASEDGSYARLDGILGGNRVSLVVRDGSVSAVFGQSWGRKATRTEVEGALAVARAGGPELDAAVEVFEKALAQL